MTQLRILRAVISDFEQNARILCDAETSHALVVDPGAEAERLFDVISRAGLRVDGIYLTHSHIDHAGGVAPLQKLLGKALPLYGHPGEKFLRQSIAQQALMFGLSPAMYHNSPEPTVSLTGGENVSVGDLNGVTCFTPGHSPGHLALYFAELAWEEVDAFSGKLLTRGTSPVLIGGDALFAGSIGRTDLPGGNHEQLLTSIRSEIFSLPPETTVFPGHGPNTTVGVEKETNSFFRGEI